MVIMTVKLLMIHQVQTLVMSFKCEWMPGIVTLGKIQSYFCAGFYRCSNRLHVHASKRRSVIQSHDY
jgi:hypothetical protein